MSRAACTSSSYYKNAKVVWTVATTADRSLVDKRHDCRDLPPIEKECTERR
jgi:hypothetical protein